ncbi:hypothetical protein BOX15_Mlig008142g3, partial [Macrostomum lignano]
FFSKNVSCIMLLPVVLIGSAGVLLFGYLYRLTKPQKSDPPCPGSDPIIGSFRYLERPLYRFMSERFARDHLVLFFLGPTRMYYLNSYAAFREAMVDNAEALSGRVTQKPIELLIGSNGGLVGTDGELWKQYRRFTLHTLRDFGLGRRGAEHCISLEAEELCSEIATRGGSEAIDVNLVLGRSVSNVICQLVFGSRLASDNPEFERILDAFNEFTANPRFQEENFKALAFLPISSRCTPLMRLLLKLPGMQGIIEKMNYLLDFCQQQVEAHAAEMPEAGFSEARDYIEAHLKHQQLNQQTDDNGADLFTNKRLGMAILDLFLAGTETTTTTLRWALIYMLANPRVASKVREEIRQHLGVQGRVCMADKAKLHYTMATLEEVQRLASLVTNGLTHRVTADIQVAGYKIPANSYMMYNMYYIHRDPDQFPEPDCFKPERYLDSESRFQASQRLIQFGAGKRACLGESLARMELFIFFVSLMQRFDFRLETDDCSASGGGKIVDQATRAQALLDYVDPEHLLVLIRHLPSYKLEFTEL